MSKLMIKDDRNCFACGPNNPIGLKMKIQRENGRAEAEVTLTPNHQGWKDIVHGGLVATLLDEIMAHAVIDQFPQAVTADLRIRYRRAVPTDQPLIAVGWIDQSDRRRVTAKSELKLADRDVVLAAGESKFLIIK